MEDGSWPLRLTARRAAGNPRELTSNQELVRSQQPLAEDPAVAVQRGEEDVEPVYGCREGERHGHVRHVRALRQPDLSLRLVQALLKSEYMSAAVSVHMCSWFTGHSVRTLKSTDPVWSPAQNILAYIC